MKTSITACLTCSKLPPPTESLKSVSPEKTASPLTTKQTMSSEWPGVGIASTAARPSRARPVDDRDAVASASSSLPTMWSAWACVRSTCVGVSPLALDGREQRLERRAGVDEHRRPAGLVPDEVGVREPAGIHAPHDEHGR